MAQSFSNCSRFISFRGLPVFGIGSLSTKTKRRDLPTRIDGTIISYSVNGINMGSGWLRHFVHLSQIGTEKFVQHCVLTFMYHYGTIEAQGAEGTRSRLGRKDYKEMLNEKTVTVKMRRIDLCKLIYACTGYNIEMQGRADVEKDEDVKRMKERSAKRWSELHDLLEEQLDAFDEKHKDDTY